jgi:hypothetical protein
VNAVTNFWIAQNIGKFICSCKTGGLSRRSQLHGVTYLLTYFVNKGKERRYSKVCEKSKRFQNIYISLECIVLLLHSVKLPFVFICSQQRLSESALLLFPFRTFVFCVRVQYSDARIVGFCINLMTKQNRPCA